MGIRRAPETGFERESLAPGRASSGRGQGRAPPCEFAEGPDSGCFVLFSSSRYLANLNRLTSDEKGSHRGFTERLPGYPLLIKAILHFNYYEKPFMNTEMFRFL